MHYKSSRGNLPSPWGSRPSENVADLRALDRKWRSSSDGLPISVVNMVACSIAPGSSLRKTGHKRLHHNLQELECISLHLYDPNNVSRNLTI